MNRRGFIGSALAVVPVLIPLPVAPRKRIKRLLSPKAVGNPEYTPMVKLSAPAPAKATIQALPGQFAITEIIKSGSNVTVTWQNGVPPFQLQHRSTLTGSWLSIGPYTVNRSVTFMDTVGFDTFRVQGYVGGASASLNANGTAHLAWIVPEV